MAVHDDWPEGSSVLRRHPFSVSVALARAAAHLDAKGCADEAEFLAELIQEKPLIREWNDVARW